MTSAAPPRVDPVEQHWTNLAANLPPTVRESFLNTILGQHRVRVQAERSRMAFAPVFGTLSRDELEEFVACHPAVERFLGRFLRALCGPTGISEQYLPAQWDKTEGDLQRITASVAGFAEHWDQNYDTSLSAFHAALAEIEGFDWLVKNFDQVEALQYSPRPGGSAPEALAWSDGVCHLVEMKSLWAYDRLTRNELRTLPNGTYVFSAGRGSRADLVVGRHNTQILRKAVNRLLQDAAAQLNTYAAGHSLNGSRLVLVVTTSRKPILGIVRSGLGMAAKWHKAHPTLVTEIIWLSAGEGTRVPREL